jgi:hypothetical protein
MQIWLDRFAGYDSRKFNFCYWLDSTAKMRRFAKRASKQMHLSIRKNITGDDTEREGFTFLKKRLRQDDFGVVILEEYSGKWCYFGIYDLTVRSAGSVVNPKLVARAAEFFVDVARTQAGPKNPPALDSGVYPQIENRKTVTSHLHRERSGYLAGERKRHDDYQCQVCGLRFEDAYGKLGECFAEAHHRVPLNKLSGKVKTRLEDLATVCANCHRMLHRMEGKCNDVVKLRAIFRKH